MVRDLISSDRRKLLGLSREQVVGVLRDPNERFTATSDSAYTVDIVGIGSDFIPGLINFASSSKRMARCETVYLHD